MPASWIHKGAVELATGVMGVEDAGGHGGLRGTGAD